MKLERDTIISHYKILSEIGRGGMGEVYLAEDTRLNRKVAIKFLSREFSEDETRLSRFVQEAKAASALNHPNIITVFEIREHDGQQFIVSEYIEGRTLARRIRQKNIALIDAIEIAIQISSALVAAHEAGIVHRDIKPDNIMIRRDGIVKILDFGLAKPAAQSPGKAVDTDAATLAKVMTLPGTLMGTPQYMSPEQARGKKTDGRTDIFSLGVVFYEMLTGHPPFTGENPMDVISSIIKDEAPPLGNYIEDVSHELQHIVDKTLRKDTDQRYQNIKDLQIDLRDFKDELKFEAKLSHSTDVQKVRETVRDTGTFASERRFSYLHAAVFVGLLGLVAGGLWWFWDSGAGRGAGLPGRTGTNLPQSLEINEIVSWSNAPGELYTTASFSPDGRMIAYSAAKSGEKSIWIKQTAASGEAVRITRDEYDNKFPIWSPDGNEIAFFSTRGNITSSTGNVTGIWRIPSLGGTPRSVAAVADGSAQLRRWGRSGRIFFDSNRNLYAADAETGQIERLTDFDEKNSPVKWIAVAPDEKRIAYVTNEKQKWKIWTDTLGSAGGEPVEILSLDTEIDDLTWHPDGQRIFYDAQIGDTIQIFAVSAAAGEPPVQITFSDRDSFLRDIAADGKTILFGATKEESNLWYVDTAEAAETALVSEINADLWADAAPDGQTVAYQSIKNLSLGDKLLGGAIKTKRIGAGEPETILAEDGYAPAWSPDGEVVAFLRRIDDRPQILTVKKSGGEAKILTEQGIEAGGFTLSPYNRTENNDFSWSPDSTGIAYVYEQNGRAEIWLISADGSSRRPLSAVADANLLLYSPIWSPDGTQIAFSAKARKLDAAGKTRRRLLVADVRTGETKTVFETDKVIRLLGWTGAGDGLIFAETDKSGSLVPEVRICRTPLATGEKNLLNTLKDAYYYNIRLSPDRKTIAFAAHRDQRDDIYIVPAAAGGAQQIRKLTGNNDPRVYFSSLSWSPEADKIFFGKQTRFTLLSAIANFQ